LIRLAPQRCQLLECLPRRGDVLILCSDGLSGQVKREEFAEYADKYPALEQLCTTLIELANTRGGPDNITVVAARFDGPGLPLDGDVQEPGYHVLALPGDEPDGDLLDREGFGTGENIPVPAKADPPPIVRPRPPVGLISAIILFGAVLLYYLITR